MPLLATDQELARHSYYAATADRGPGFPALRQPASCDVAIVGGGLAGLSAALELRQRGFDVVLLEAHEVGWGASGRNGGQAIHGLACDQDEIERQLGLDEARRVWAMSIEALDLLRERIAAHGIACDWRDGYLGLATNARKGAGLAAWAERIGSVYGYPLQRVAAADVGRWIASPRYHSGIHDPRSGHLHPLKYTLGLARAAAAAGVRIHEHTPVQALQQGAAPVLRTAGGTLRARQVLLAGNVYLHGIAPQLEPRIMPVGTYIACSEVLPDAVADSLIPSRSAVCDTNFVLDYFRTTNDQRMLYGGRVSYSTMTPANLAESMRRRMVHTFPQLAGTRVDYAWGGFVDISMNRAPDFGRLPAAAGSAANVYYLQGFSGHGLALTGLAGRVVAEAMAGDARRFDVFARLRHRPFPGGALLRTPALVLGMAWYRLRDLLG
ncbi:NAD(P)/FAD-dependent oxidoreductase [Rubrivivax sp. RP6-9]|uniref:NAD(P)/FAD-dependent oxidoreductase n=1 Tax=Rubrivivax sp. RP6-9 TaxID=3415750 RepID=UPI003CC653A9